MARRNYTVNNVSQVKAEDVQNKTPQDGKKNVQDTTDYSKKQISPQRSVSKLSKDDEVEIPILNNVIGSKYSWMGKSIWIIILLTCACTMLSSIIQRIIYFNSEPVNIGIRIHNNESMHYPDISICKIKPSVWKQDIVSDMKKQVSNGTGIPYGEVTNKDILSYFNINIMELWLMTSYTLEEIVSTVSQNQTKY